MKLAIAAVGRLKRGPEFDLAARYRERAFECGRGIGFRALDILEIEESRARRAPDRMAEEAAALTKIIPENAVIIALDARGKNLSSPELAERLGHWRDDGRASACFMIGGADGLAEPIRRQAGLQFAFGSATWPHQLVRIMVLEQIYRCMTILAGHPYHRE